MFCEQSELTVVAACYSSAPHEPFLPFPFLPLNVALLESPLGRHSKNQCSNVLHDRLEEWLPTNGGRSFHCDLPRRRPRLVASFDTKLSRSMLDSSSSAQMTTVHPILVSSLLHRSHQVGSAFRSRLEAVRPFFIQEITEVRDTPNVRSSPRKLLRSS